MRRTARRLVTKSPDPSYLSVAFSLLILFSRLSKMQPGEPSPPALRRRELESDLAGHRLLFQRLLHLKLLIFRQFFRFVLSSQTSPNASHAQSAEPECRFHHRCRV